MLFDQYCETCHATHGDTVVVGPSLAGIGDRAGKRTQQYNSAEYIEYSIKEPGDYLVQGFSDLMPQELANTLTEEEIDALVAYLMTLD